MHQEAGPLGAAAGENFLVKHINRLFFISRIGKLVFPLL
jgi:hypothetical protein